MAYLTKSNPQGRTRQIGRRGFKKGSYFAQFSKANEPMSVLDSRLEIQAAIAADLDPMVSNIKVQPFTIDVTTAQIFHSKQSLDQHRMKLKARGLKGIYYTPDILLKTKEGLTKVLEIKDVDWLSFSAEYEEKLLAAIRIMELHGIDFQIFSNKFDTALPYVQNLKLLHSLNSEIRKDELCPALLTFRKNEEKLQGISREMYETGEMLSIQSISKKVDVGPTEICVAMIFGIFKAPIWTEQINLKTFVAGTDFGNPCFVRYQDFNRGV